MNPRVISASRRIDMVGTAPENLSGILRAKFPPSEVHTLVVWTKDPSTLLHNRSLRETVSGYRQLFVHCTITGMGATRLEPGSPPMERALFSLKELVEFVGLPERIRVRFDPLVHLVFPDGRKYSNICQFKRVVELSGALGIPSIIVSWMQRYPKVERRLAARGIGIEPVSRRLLKQETDYMKQVCTELGLSLLGCCAPALQSSRCINGELLGRLHPLGLRCSQAKARGQRTLCKCTESLDIGWYSSCAHGCLYCYANPDTAVSAEERPWPQ
jgi:hypothetical protein